MNYTTEQQIILTEFTKNPKNKYYSNLYYEKIFKAHLSIGEQYEKLALTQLINYFEGKYNLKRTNADNKYDFELTNSIKYKKVVL